MKIAKYHGCGNNFVILREGELPAHIRTSPEEERLRAYSRLALQLCDVNIGVGSDGFMVVREEPELEMVFFNKDGSRATMCGNGIRCFAHYCLDHGIREEAEYPVKTLAGTLTVHVVQDEPFRARIMMGKPLFEPAAIPVASDGQTFLGQEVELADGSRVELDAMFMGTTHAVVFVEEIDRAVLEPLGRELCFHPVFPEQTNVNFVKVEGEDTIRVLTYERGVGVTLACGTGSCASVVAAGRRGLTGRRVDVQLALGTLGIEILEDGTVTMEGPSEHIFDGTIEG